MDELGPLPFMLSQENLAKVQIAYASYSAKTGVGKSEISIFGVGRVKLLEETCLDDPNPKVLEGEIPLPILVRVLDAMEEEEFFALEDTLSAQRHPHRHAGNRAFSARKEQEGNSHAACTLSAI